MSDAAAVAIGEESAAEAATVAARGAAEAEAAVGATGAAAGPKTDSPRGGETEGHHPTDGRTKTKPKLKECRERAKENRLHEVDALLIQDPKSELRVSVSTFLLLLIFPRQIST